MKNGRPKGAPTEEYPNKNYSLFNIHHSFFIATARSHTGITLIALIITIILLLILAGVTIHFTLGENGILRNAGIAANKYKQAGENEKNMLDQIYAYINGEEKLQPNTPETKAGTPVEIPNEWYTNSPTLYSMPELKEIEKSKRTASVYAVSDGKNNTIPIPVGFYYVGGNLSTGVVISDNKEDANKYKNVENGKVPSGIKVEIVDGKKKIVDELQGNQFVWIPCEEEEYKKCDTWNGIKQYYNSNASELASGNWDKTTNSAELTQIKKYGGFYIGRYEAGLPSSIEEATTAISGSATEYNTVAKPQSKAGRVPWNSIDYLNAQKSARSMYNIGSVTSGLITGTQWDVMLNKMQASGEITGEDIVNSKNWGNYANTELQINIGRKSKVHADSYATPRIQEPFGEIEQSIINIEDDTQNVIIKKPLGNEDLLSYLLTTGLSNQARVYNIYDVAGNLHEWTEESSNFGENANIYISCRGGNLWNVNAGSSYRNCRFLTNGLGIQMGFRVVLYVK